MNRYTNVFNHENKKMEAIFNEEQVSMEQKQSLINTYQNHISNYQKNKNKFLNTINMIDTIIDKLNSSNILMEEVIISGKRYDDGFLTNTITNLSGLREQFVSFYNLCNQEIDRLNGCIASLGGNN